MPSLQDISLRQLQYVVAVADSLGFRRAAERCHVSQPTLSAQVAHVESVLGVTIFERDSKGVMVTAAGEPIVKSARRALLEVEDLLAVASRVRDPFAGTFRFGVIPTVAPYLLPEIMPAMLRAYPNLRVTFREEKTEDVVRDLESGQLDAGVVALEADLGDVACEEILKDAFVLAVPESHRLAKRKRIGPADLEDEDVLLLDDGHCFRDQALGICAKARAREADVRATSLSTLVQMVSAGEGVTLLPKLAVEVENRRGQIEVRPFTQPTPSRTIALVWRKNAPFGEALRAIAGTMKKAVKKVAGG